MTAVKKAATRFRVNPTVHVYVKSQLIVEHGVHAPAMKDAGLVEFIADAPCTLSFDSDQLFGAFDVDLDPGPNLVEIKYDNPPGEKSHTFTYDIHHPLHKKKNKKLKMKALMLTSKVQGDPNDIIVP